MNVHPVLESLRGGLIVSCQAPAGSPLDDAYLISALARTAELNGAVGVRINTPAHIAATRLRVEVPILGIEKVVTEGSDVYITPTFEIAAGVAEAGAHVIAIDATARPRPGGEALGALLPRIQRELQRPVMADVATFDEGLRAADLGADLVATTLCGYTAESRGARLPALDLVERLAARLNVPVVCEGGIESPGEMRQAFDRGAFAVVVGTALTGIGQRVRRFVDEGATPSGRE